MQISAECRWFTSDQTTGESLRNWFFDPKIHGHAAGGGSQREDCYLYDPKQKELGIKRRGSNHGIEIKGLVYVDPTLLRCGSLTASVEIWSKWATTAMDLSNFQTIAVQKKRWLRKFDTSNSEAFEIPLGKDEQPVASQQSLERGCNVEATEIEVQGRVWFSLGLEAFGQLANVDASLRATATILTSRGLPELAEMIAASYPRWISDHCGG